MYGQTVTSEQCLQAARDLLAASAMEGGDAAREKVARAAVYASMAQAQAIREQTEAITRGVHSYFLPEGVNDAG
jgi:TPR repeat protein